MIKAVCLSAVAAGIASLAPHSAKAADENAATWTDSITMSGDLRLRYEVIKWEGRDDRKQTRYRGRFGIAADVADDISLVIGLATGNDNPVSTNQTFGDGFSTKDIGLDLLFVNWAINDDFRFFGGKMRQPWIRAGGTTIMWDSDLNPEGGAIGFDRGTLFASGGGFLVQEESADTNTMLYYGQGGARFKFGDVSNLMVGASYFAYDNTIGVEPFYLARSKGNTVDADGNYVYEYKIVEAFAQYGTVIGNWPFVAYANFIRNTAQDVIEDSAYSLGFTVGRAKKKGSMQFNYNYHDTGADAMIGTFTDSDFAGGNTDSRGHYMKGRYTLRENLYLGFTLIISEFGEFTGLNQNYDRLMLDFDVKF